MTDTENFTALPTRRPRSRGRSTPRKRSRATSSQLDRGLATRAGTALVLVNMRYWSSIAPLVRSELRRWRYRAQAIDDPVLRELAVQKLDAEGFNAEAAALLATLAPRKHRRAVVAAMVAAEILYDYLDGLTEAPSPQTPDDGAHLFAAFTDAVAPSLPRVGDYYRAHPRTECCYLEELVTTVREALRGLPATARLEEVMRASAIRGATAQLHIHRASLVGSDELERWAQLHSVDSALEWREFLAGAACSVLAVHALVVAASDRRMTVEHARELDRFYLSISVLPTILDSLLDHEADRQGARAGYVTYYADRDVLTGRLASVIEDAITRSRGAPNGAHHLMTLAGVVAYYTSDPASDSDFARPVIAHISRQLQPLLAPTLAMMRSWRAAKRLRARGQEALHTRVRRAT